MLLQAFLNTRALPYKCNTFILLMSLREKIFSIIFQTLSYGNISPYKVSELRVFP